MGAQALIISVMVLAGADPVGDIINAQNVPGIVLLSSTGIVGMFFVVRWMVKFQKEFTAYYVEENKKLRERVDELEDEVRTKDTKIDEQARHINQMQIQLDRNEARLAEHEATITRLNRIIDRRRLNDD